MKFKESFSLLYPDKNSATSFTLDQQVISDLDIEFLLQFMVPRSSNNHTSCESVKNILLHPCSDEQTIHYRQDIIENLLAFPALLHAFEKLLPIIEALSYYRSARHINQSLLYTVVSRICELERYIACMETLKEVFDSMTSGSGNNSISSKGLQGLYEYIVHTYKSDVFLHMKKNLPRLAEEIRNIKSVTLGVNLGNSLRPVEATLVSVNTKRFTKKSRTVFTKLFSQPLDTIPPGEISSGDSDSNPFHGIAALHSLAQVSSPLGLSASDTHPLLRALFDDLAEVLEKISMPIQKALNHYIKINTSLFINIKEDLFFYIKSTRLLMTIREKGLPVCKPTIVAPEKRVIKIEDTYNINLFIQMYKKNAEADIKTDLITNRVNLGAEGRIILLTGPNQGGKTVYTQGIGLSQLLFQSGLFIPGSKGEMSPADNIFTHFQIEEHITNETGRFADEARRLYEIINKATSTSLILLNESFASTNYTESLYIAYDIMKIFRALGVRVVFSTHFHDLALQVNEINDSIQGDSQLISLVSMVETEKGKDEQIKRTFRIIPHPPMGQSYARDIARKYGIGFEQLKGLLEKRGMM
ncbi:MAG: hypothetical protein JXJ04_04205 [Spirochaetales bacterium]|nr:hypothetical protein [Spirochaetales bacterium]